MLRRTKPLTPKVEGIKLANVFQYQGMAEPGQLTPLRNSIGTEVNTAIKMMLSRLFGMPLMEMAKKTQASRKGRAKSAMSSA